MKRGLAVLILVSLLVLAFGCMSTKPPTKESVAKAIEDVDRYEFQGELRDSGSKMINNFTSYIRGGFYYSREEAYWEIEIHEEKAVRYINETILGDLLYYSYILKAGGRIVEDSQVTETLQEYFDSIKDNTNITSPEDLKWKILKGSDPMKNPLYFIKELLENSNITKIEKTNKGHLIEFTFKIQKRYSNFGNVLYITNKGNGKMLIKNNLPIEAEISAMRIAQTNENHSTIRKYDLRISFFYEYKRPEWVRRVTEK
ncbi:hypothetical protein [Thermococcus barophilus]|uniref:Lipoprotein n=1 Tax=Thermococcus barophilus (strain DSM 11836 / MP) TaxID=391623 RepID=F0LI55_THEBM|nr:hypothetical protein [Thermococcus barophilus]ADT83209.1 hypothetical protein TERMP_00232 [Thermococcus barophilus MP]